jgi:uncharacterized membrane protein
MADDVKNVEPVVTGSPEDIEKAKGMTWLAYLGILFLVPLLSLKESPFAKFHVKQGILLCIFIVAVSILGAIPFLGWFVIWPVGYIFAVVMAIMGIVNSLGGKYWKMPILGGMAAKWFKF